MPKTKEDPEFEFGHVLDKLDDEERGPTELMEHIAEWIQEKTGFDPSDKSLSREDAFNYGVWLTVALRPDHQRSVENQERLAASKARSEELAAERAERRAQREQSRATRETETVEKPRKGRRGSAAATETEEEPVKPARRGRPPKSAETAAEPEVVTPIRRGRPARRSVAAEKTAETATATATPEKPKRAGRRPAARQGEAAF